MNIKQKLTSIWYWIHWAVIGLIVLAILQFFQGGEMLNVKNVIYSTPLIAIGDIISGSILKFFKKDID